VSGNRKYPALLSNVWVNCGAVRQVLVGSHLKFPVRSTQKVSLPRQPARAATQQHTRPMPRVSNAGGVIGPAGATAATGDADWSFQVGSSPQFADLATLGHTSNTRAETALFSPIASSTMVRATG
jgi:hypothetical protein